jgi:hypothetical protein
MRRLKLPAAALAAICLILYFSAIQARKNAVFFETAVAPNKLYSIDKYFIYPSDSGMMFRVFDQDHKLIGEYIQMHHIGHPTLRNQWACTKDHCTEYRWNSADNDRILLPPSWLDELRAKLP